MHKLFAKQANPLNKECSHGNNTATQTCVVNGVSFFLFIVLSSIVSGTDRLIILLVGEKKEFSSVKREYVKL